MSQLSIWILEDYGTDNWTLKHMVNTWILFGWINIRFGYRKKVHVIPIRVFWYGRRTIKNEFICRPYYLPYVPLFLDSLAEQ